MCKIDKDDESLNQVFDLIDGKPVLKTAIQPLMLDIDGHGFHHDDDDNLIKYIDTVIMTATVMIMFRTFQFNFMPFSGKTSLSPKILKLRSHI